MNDFTVKRSVFDFGGLVFDNVRIFCFHAQQCICICCSNMFYSLFIHLSLETQKDLLIFRKSTPQSGEKKKKKEGRWEKDDFNSQNLNGKLPYFAWSNPGLGIYKYNQSQKKVLSGILGKLSEVI